MAASLVRTSSGETKVAWVDSALLANPTAHLMDAVDARAKALRDRMPWRGGRVYAGYGSTLIAGEFLFVYALVVGGIAPAARL